MSFPTDFKNRFTDLKGTMPMICMAENPYSTDVREVSQYCEKFGISREKFGEELIELKNNNTLKQKYKDEPLVDFWMHFVPDVLYGTVSLCAKKILTCFG